MAATTRWVEYSATAVTSTYIGATTNGVGTRGQVKANSSVEDKFTIGPTNSTLRFNIDAGTERPITLTSGVDLDARFVARDITEKMHVVGITDDSWDHATCEWKNNAFYVYSGNLGAASSITVASGTNTAYDTLGFTDSTSTPGGVHSYGTNNYSGNISVSGTWEGMFDEMYTIVVNNSITSVGAPGGAGGTYSGNFISGGQFNASADDTYTITVDITNGPTAGGGSGNVPTFSWTSTGSDNSAVSVEILYVDHWYTVGTKGVKVKWVDDLAFGGDESWTIVGTKPDHAHAGGLEGAVGTAQYVWTSTRGDDCSAAVTTSVAAHTQLGSRGLQINFSGGSGGGINLKAGDEFRVVCTGPQPTNYGISSINYGNVTVTTDSDVKCVLFEIMGGAVTMDAVRFGLQNKGTFSYHGAGTDFKWGVIGADKTAGASPTVGKEWRTGIVASDLVDAHPTYINEAKTNLSVVATAGDSEAIGNYQGGLVSDFVYLCIHLGPDETGSNSSINQRLFFDYS